MELPTDVLIHNAALGWKGSPGRLLRIAEGYYEVNVNFGERVHRVLLPVGDTVIMSKEAEPAFQQEQDIER